MYSDLYMYITLESIIIHLTAYKLDKNPLRRHHSQTFYCTVPVVLFHCCSNGSEIAEEKEEEEVLSTQNSQINCSCESLTGAH